MTHSHQLASPIILLLASVLSIYAQKIIIEVLLGNQKRTFLGTSLPYLLAYVVNNAVFLVIHIPAIIIAVNVIFGFIITQFYESTFLKRLVATVGWFSLIFAIESLVFAIFVAYPASLTVHVEKNGIVLLCWHY